MPPADDAINAVASADSWDARVALIRKIPEQFGTAEHAPIYGAIARDAYVPHLAPDFAYVHWRDDYELLSLQDAYARAYELTGGFSAIDVRDLASAIEEAPETLRIFRLLLGFTTQEFAAATALVATRSDLPVLQNGRIKSIEGGSRIDARKARTCATVVDETIRGMLFGAAPIPELRPKTDKPDTLNGWETVRTYAAGGVPLPVFSASTPLRRSVPTAA